MSAWMEVCNRLAEVWWPWVFHASWQGALVAGFVLLLVRAGRRWSSAIRYALLLVALLKFVLPPVLPVAAGPFGLISIPPPKEAISRPVAVVPAGLMGIETGGPPMQVGVAPRPAAREASIGSEAPIAQALTGGAIPGSEASTPLTAAGWMLVLYLLGMSVLCVWTLIGLFRLGAWIREAEACRSGALHERTQAIARAFGIRRPVRLLVSPRPVTPMAFGWIRPAVMVPRSLVDELSLDEQATIVAHELMHHRRWDVWVNSLQVLVGIAYWFHPLVWPLNRAIRRVREECCDDALLCLHGIGRSAYCDVLVRSASNLALPAPWQCTLGLAGRMHPLAGRLRRIMDPSRRPVARLSARGAAAVALAALCLWPGLRRVTAQADAAAKPETETTASSPSALTLTIVDPGGRPVPGVRLAGGAYLVGWEPKMVQGVADADGVCRFDWGDDAPLGWWISALGDGYAVVTFRWIPPTHGPIPETYTLTLAAAVPIGGRVIDPAGNPLAGAEVTSYLPGGSDSSHRESPKEHFGSFEGFHVERTGEDGTWTCRHLPPDLEGASLEVAHADFGKQNFPVSAVGIDALRNQTAELPMESGVSFQGIVVDAAGRPIEGAIANLAPLWHEDDQRSTDADGRFRFDHQEAREHTLIVAADGYAPSLQTVDLMQENALVTIQLNEGAEVSGRVVDEHGDPMEGVRFVVQAWRGNNTLRGVTQQTGPDGRFVWDSAPAGEPVELFFGKRGYFHVRDYAVNPPATGLRITLEPVLQVRGQVVDAGTGEPLDGVKAIPGYGMQTSYRWHTGSTHLVTDGKLDVAFDEKDPPYSLKVTADGYQPFVSELWDGGTNPIELDVALHKLSDEQLRPIAGRVLLPDGDTPAVGAQVGLANDAVPNLLFTPTGLYNAPALHLVETDDRGEFSFANDPEARQLAVWHEEGYALLDAGQLNTSMVVRLELFARLEGQVLTGAEPQTNVSISVSVAWSYYCDHGFLGGPEVDGRGRFVIARIPPGNYLLSASDGVHYKPFTHNTPVVLEPGQIHRVTMGGRGWKVTGRFTISEDNTSLAVFDDRRNWDAFLRSPPSDNRPPVGLTEEARRSWFKEFDESDEGRKQHLSRRNYPINVGADGAFVIHDVLPGDYTLSVFLQAPTADQMGRGEVLGQFSKEITVPALATPLPEEPIGLGLLEITMRKTVDPGRPAPGFEVTTLDGESVQLSDYQGKVVLLDFWATWCGPCLVELPHLKQVYDEFKDHPRFAMLSLSLDRDHQALHTMIADQGLDWTHAWLGEWSKTDIPDRYGVYAIPALFLIGPDGLIHAKDLRGPAIRAAVASALDAIP